MSHSGLAGGRTAVGARSLDITEGILLGEKLPSEILRKGEWAVDTLHLGYQEPAKSVDVRQPIRSQISMVAGWSNSTILFSVFC